MTTSQTHRCSLIFSGPRFPLTQAFAWAGWRTTQPLDLKIDPEFDLNDSSVRKAIATRLPECHLCSARGKIIGPIEVHQQIHPAVESMHEIPERLHH